MSERNLLAKEGKKKKHKNRIEPSEDDEYTFELDSLEEEKIRKKSKKWSLARKSIKGGNMLNPLINIPAIKSGLSKWRDYATNRRTSSSINGDKSDRRRTGGLGLEPGRADYAKKDSVDGDSCKVTANIVATSNKALIDYFAELAASCSGEDCINLDFVDTLLKNGAKVGCTDKYGQCVLHEVARAWHPDVAKFLIEHGAEVNQADAYGRTALHIAAAVDYGEMVDFLIEHGANKEAATVGELQTPLHYAARNDACNSLKALIKQGANYKDVRDHKGRTPLHLAAELDRSETALQLLELDDPAPAGVQDDSGQAAIVWMIQKMPPVAKVALDQFHTTDRANRKQYYHLHKLEPQKPDEKVMGEPQSALVVATNYRRFDLILHPVFLRCIRIKWVKFGRLRAFFNLFLNLSFIILWTTLGMVVEYDQRYKYDLPEQWWRILLLLLAGLLTIYQIVEELREFFRSKNSHRGWKNWRLNEIERDRKFCHPRWPEEQAYLDEEAKDLDSQSPQYFSDFWNIFDWLCYFLLSVCVTTHIIDVFRHSIELARAHNRIMACTIIILWLRLMKNARAFSLLGPFIVMLSHMLQDIAKFAFLYMEFYIPFACAFWMMFGGDKVREEFLLEPNATSYSNYTIVVPGYKDPGALLVSLFRLTLVDDYPYDDLKAVDSLMADLLVVSWLALSAILMLNLFIALLSDTFQRVYDNAQANAVMQKAITILNTEEGMTHSRREKFRRYIHEHCSPEPAFYDDDATESAGEDLQKVTIQIKESLDELRDDIKEGRLTLHGYSTESNRKNNKEGTLVTVERFEDEINHLRRDMREIQRHQVEFLSRFKRDMSILKTLLSQVVQMEGPEDEDAPDRLDSGEPDRRGIPLNAMVPGLPSRPPPYVSGHGHTPPRGSDTITEWVDMENDRRQELDVFRREVSTRARHSQFEHSDTQQSESTGATVDIEDTAATPSANVLSLHGRPPSDGSASHC